MTPDAIFARDFPPKPWDAASLAQVLGETEPQPQHELAVLCEVLGSLSTWRLLQKTLALEARGGLLVRDGSRQRMRGAPSSFWPGSGVAGRSRPGFSALGRGRAARHRHAWPRSPVPSRPWQKLCVMSPTCMEKHAV
jgi:hypothetical protein